MTIRYWAVLMAMLMLVGCGKGDKSDAEVEGTSPDSEFVDDENLPGDDVAETQDFDDGVFESDTTTTSAGVDEVAVEDVLSKEEVQAIAKGRFERALEKVPPFDRDEATRTLMLEKYNVNMDDFPEKALSPKELRALFMSGLKLRADENFPAADREHVAKQAAEQFPLYKRGDHIKLQLARGLVEGTIESLDTQRIKVDGRIVLVRDIRAPPPEAFDEARVDRRRRHYISLNYEQPRQTYIAQLDEEERDTFYTRHFYVKGTSGWFRADQVFSRLKAKEGAKLERQYMDEQRFLLRKKIEQELRDEGLWR
jgi:hypothetical protein